MRTAQSYADGYKRLIDSDYYITEKDFKKAINEARKEAIEECIQIVNTNSIINANNFIQPKLRTLIKELK